MKKSLSLLLLALLLSSTSFSQDFKKDSLAITEIIHSIFDGMRESDTTKMAPHFHKAVRTQSLAVNKGGNKVSDLNGVEAWLTAVANNSGAVWNEQINNMRIHSDGALAIAWMDYQFFLGDQLSHCGVNSFQFVKVNEKWKIIYIIDSRKKEKCL